MLSIFSLCSFSACWSSANLFVFLLFLFSCNKFHINKLGEYWNTFTWDSLIFIIVKLDVVAHYLNIPHETGPQLIEEALWKSKDKHIPTDKIENVAEFVFNEKRHWPR